ncbi:MAG: sulfotransferase family protein [Draconibacterium sp.]
MKKLPNFLIVGASKSGTSSLYHYLKQHPDIYLSEKQKEGRYFSQMKDCFKGPGDKVVAGTVINSLERYSALFEGYNGQEAIGDISPEYLYFYEKAIPLIRSTLGSDVRIIIILRNPVDRAFSAYTHFVRDKRETLSFEEALQKEEERNRQRWIWAWQYKNSGFYFKQVKAYLDQFEYTKVIVYDHLIDHQDKVIKEICSFIGVNPGFKFDTTYKYNVSGSPKSQVLYKLETSRSLVAFVKKLLPKGIISKLKRNLTGEKQMVKQEINPKTRTELIGFFKEDILKLQDLIGQDLSPWLENNTKFISE